MQVRFPYATGLCNPFNNLLTLVYKNTLLNSNPKGIKNHFLVPGYASINEVNAIMILNPRQGNATCSLKKPCAPILAPLRYKSS